MAGDGGAFVDQAGVDLDEGCACLEFFIGVRGVENAADADDRKAAFGEVANNLSAAGAERTSAESTGFGICGILGIRARDGGICRDDAGDFARAGEFDDFVECLERKVGGDFDEDGLANGVIAADLLDRGKHFVEGGLIL